MALHYGDTTMHTDIRHDGAPSHGTTGQHTIGAAILWGLLFGGMQAASPLLIWWLAPGTVYAISLILIAPISIGFAVADGRPIIIAVESSVAAIFVVVAAAAHRPSMAACDWLSRACVQGFVAAPPPVCCRYALVGALLLHRRPGCSSTDYPCDTRRTAVTALAPGPQRARATDAMPDPPPRSRPSRPTGMVGTLRVPAASRR